MVRRGRQAVSAAAAVLTEAGIVADRRRRTRSRPGLVVFADGRTKRDQSWMRTRGINHLEDQPQADGERERIGKQCRETQKIEVAAEPQPQQR